MFTVSVKLGAASVSSSNSITQQVVIISGLNACFAAQRIKEMSRSHSLRYKQRQKSTLSQNGNVPVCVPQG